MDKKKKKVYSTKYKLGRKYYGTHIYADSIYEAREIAKRRNIGEKELWKQGVVTNGYGQKMNMEIMNPDFRNLSNYEFLNKLPEIIHSACFMGFILSKQGKAKTEDLIGDGGIIHELIHLLQSGTENPREFIRIRGQFHAMQMQVEGMFDFK